MKKRSSTTRGNRSPTSIDRTVGSNLRKLRTERDMTLQDLAVEIGISHQQLQKYETGMNRLSAGMLPVVAEALGVEIMEFFDDAERPGPATRTPADRLRHECERWLRRTNSEELLRTMSRVLKALSA